MTVKKKIQLKRASAAELASLNPVLAAGEVAVDLTNHKLKVGDGTTAYNSLPYVEGEIDLSNYYTKSQTYSKGEVESLLADKVDTEDLATVATTGDYNDLSNKPVIPDVSTLATKTELADGLAEKQDAFEADSPLVISLASSAQNLKIENNSVVQNATPASNLPKYATTTYDNDAYFIVGNNATSPNISTIEQMFSGGYVDIPLPTTGSFSFMTGCRTNVPNFVLGKGSGNNFIPIATFNPQYNNRCGLWLNMSDTYSIYNDAYQSRLVIPSTPIQANTFIGEGGGGVSAMDMAVAIYKYRSDQYALYFNFPTDSAGETWYCSEGYVQGSNLTRIDEITTLRVFVNSDSASFNKEHIGVYNYAGTFYALDWETLGANQIDIEALINGSNRLQLNIGNGLTVQNGSLVNTLVDELYYKAGDTFTTSANLYCTGVLTAGAEGIRFTLPLPKCTSKVSSATIQKLVVAIRRPEGGYFYNSVDLVQNSNISNLRCTFPTPNQLSVYFEDSTITSSNNIVLSVQLANNGTQITFS